MELKKSIKPILSNGGWCELNPNNSERLAERILGRIVLVEKEHLVIQNYNLSSNFLDGFILIEKKKVRKLKGGNWVKRILTVGGEIIESPKIPDCVRADSIFILIHNLIAHYAKCHLTLDDGQNVFGKLRLKSNGELAIYAFNIVEPLQENIIGIEDILMLRIGTLELRKK